MTGKTNLSIKAVGGTGSSQVAEFPYRETRLAQSADKQVEFRSIEKRYGHHQVLSDLSLSIKRGEKLSLIGPSGSGKTTVLRILMTLETIQGGSIWIDGKPLWHEERNGQLVKASQQHLRRQRAKIGMVFQHFNLFPHMTALENISQPQRIVLGRPRVEADVQALELLDMVGLRERAHHYPAQLSGGQKQRVAIARALAMKPEIMLFDEITSALDPELVEEVLNVLREIGRTSDMTMLLVTHEMTFAKEFSDRVLFMDGGRIVEEGEPDQLFSAPTQDRTRSFLRKIIAAGQRI
ncbi:ectoine/hydroxyectoine ABC transporter ATP-binding protein EhuA [Pararhizobium sp. YC-54]|uniref:ectoine/hydroxyectoine ABC transporter ATP-binding protein EhuA n=1 Tax=Pararhizobium sp. YC-54 TaxID=2986920 RepID=UPI0021F7FBFD|nr:ectoine/hydroxyectoine ABC transporter ATP-binding protein EhuA [Pararhizobium sp. YC-54]MCV9999364.1 ectoine/hydroxyectoine ABC transporter ATP-binding protein EhuA [Pararhizobium sp. YC-54]